MRVFKLTLTFVLMIPLFIASVAFANTPTAAGVDSNLGFRQSDQAGPVSQGRIGREAPATGNGSVEGTCVNCLKEANLETVTTVNSDGTPVSTDSVRGQK
jgi:uncharacterized membrane protein